jgi:hypothetical protein
MNLIKTILSLFLLILISVLLANCSKSHDVIVYGLFQGDIKPTVKHLCVHNSNGACSLNYMDFGEPTNVCIPSKSVKELWFIMKQSGNEQYSPNVKSIKILFCEDGDVQDSTYVPLKILPNLASEVPIRLGEKSETEQISRWINMVVHNRGDVSE